MSCVAISTQKSGSSWRGNVDKRRQGAIPLALSTSPGFSRSLPPVRLILNLDFTGAVLGGHYGMIKIPS
jgi:hypothetical protein